MWWARGLFLATGVALLALVLHEADLHTAAAAVAAFGVPALLAVVALYGVEFLADTASWHLAMPSIAFNAGWLRQLFVTRLVGEAVNAVTPLAGMGGEPVKAWFLKRRHAIEYGESAASLVIARTVNLLALLPFLAIGAMLAAADSQLFGAYGVAAGLGFVALAAATLAFFAVQRLRIASSLARLCRQPPAQQGADAAIGEPRGSGRRLRARIGRRVAESLAWIDAFDDRLAHFYTRRQKRFAIALALAFLNWCTGALGVYITMRLLGVEFSMADAWILESLVQLVRAGTFFIPANIGAQEGVYVFVVGALTGNASAGLAAALIRRCRELVWIAAGLAIGSVQAGGAARGRESV